MTDTVISLSNPLVLIRPNGEPGGMSEGLIIDFIFCRSELVPENLERAVCVLETLGAIATAANHPRITEQVNQQISFSFSIFPAHFSSRFNVLSWR